MYVGPHWYVHVGGLVCYSAALLLFNLFATAHLTALWRFGLALVNLSSVFSFLLIGLANPGLETEQDVDLPFTADRYCRICRIVRRKGTVHCRDCDVCITEYDHHCPWTGKCIGRGNLVLFYVFVGSMSASFLLGMLAMVGVGNMNE